MPTPPSLANVKAYLGTDHSWSDDEISSALTAETVSQAKRCTIPADPDPEAPVAYPADLAEALCRRVAHNLALRGLPLGLQSTVTEMGASNARVGGIDAETRRLEGPYRRLGVG
jgi:hypothetical protein